MLSTASVRRLLNPFHVNLSDEQLEQILVYLSLLQRWNQKINLTAIRSPEECVTRHFGESFLISPEVPNSGRLLDVGSGAGFPGLASKILSPGLDVVLLEPVAKKRAFLKEVARECKMRQVEVIGKTLGEFSAERDAGLFDIVTIRAVGKLTSIITEAYELIRLNGIICLWIGSKQLAEVSTARSKFNWQIPISIPLSSNRIILVGSKGQAT